MDKIESFSLENFDLFSDINLYWVGGGAALLLLSIIIALTLRGVKKSKARKIAPDLTFQAFQISPLGKDAWLRLRNTGHLAVLKDVKFKKRKDILVKGAFRENKIGTDTTVNLFLHATQQDRIREDFDIEILYSDAKGRLYRQNLKLDGKVMMKAKAI